VAQFEARPAPPPAFAIRLRFDRSDQGTFSTSRLSPLRSLSFKQAQPFSVLLSYHGQFGSDAPDLDYFLFADHSEVALISGIDRGA
jgi:hypothetical protein